jgi:hypothetical protein
MPDHSQFNIDRTYPGRWTITFSQIPPDSYENAVTASFHAGRVQALPA